MGPNEDYHKIEPYPRTGVDKPFPEGDITTGVIYSAERRLGSLWSGDLVKQRRNFEKFINREVSYWKSDNAQQSNLLALRGLSYCWGKTIDSASDSGAILARDGVLGTISLANKARMFSLDFVDFYDDLNSMADHDGPAIKVFADEAWGNMFNSHPNLFKILSNFRRYIGGLNFEDYDNLRRTDNDNPELVLLDAAVALPYTLSVISSMEKVMDKQLNGSFKNRRNKM